jgi:hypothetical protein
MNKNKQINPQIKKPERQENCRAGKKEQRVQFVAL